jgi:bifunctional pyridoxal-dependent enzyme with beta-cystathionase and maltose regulon repressor activities
VLGISGALGPNSTGIDRRTQIYGADLYWKWKPAKTAAGFPFVSWQTEVLVTSGATEALGDCLFGLIEPGDEVVLIEPLYDSYLPIVRRAGGIAKLVRLEPPTWRLPRDELAAAFSDRTKLILFNTPMNPCLKVFIATNWISSRPCLKHDAYAV